MNFFFAGSKIDFTVSEIDCALFKIDFAVMKLIFNKLDRSLVSRNSIIRKFKMLWFPKEARY